jgi:hypothetical protein
MKGALVPLSRHRNCDRRGSQRRLSQERFNRPEVKPVEVTIANWWRQGMMGGAKAHDDGLCVFADGLYRGSEEDHDSVTGDA